MGWAPRRVAPSQAAGTDSILRQGWFPARRSCELAVQIHRKKNQAGPPEPPGTKVDEVQQFISAKYNDQSTLKVQIASGHVKHDFDLKSQSSR